MNIYVKITKSSSPEYWYADRIGEEFSVNPEIKRMTHELFGKYVTSGGFANIDERDCELINPKSPNQ